MAGFDPEQDKKLKEWRSEETGLCISICQYKDGEPKVQIGPRIIKKKDGTDGAPRKAGRFTIEDVDRDIEEIRARHRQPVPTAQPDRLKMLRDRLNIRRQSGSKNSPTTQIT